MLNPPQPGEPSYEQFRGEREAELASLRRRAHMVTDAFNSLEGMTCNFTEGAMYSFPQVRTTHECRCRCVSARARAREVLAFSCLHGTLCAATPRGKLDLSVSRLHMVCTHTCCVADPAAAQSPGGGQGAGQGRRCVLLPEAVGGYRHLHRAGLRVWPGGGRFCCICPARMSCALMNAAEHVHVLLAVWVSTLDKHSKA